MVDMLKIAIDGPAGSGKSTVSKIIAKKLNINYLDTGAMYRMCTLKVLNEKIDLDDEKKITDVIDKIDIKMENNVFYLDNNDVSELIRDENISKNVSKVAAIKFVREKMVDIQREIATKADVIMDGRDIGTHVLKESKNKFYLNASIEVRAERRYEELINKGANVIKENIIEDIAKRDKFDSERENSPLIKADDAIEIDTSGLNIEEVVDLIISKIGEKND
ncbi:(d)CMP kinase [Clostridiaceae bacterium HSG29]|nr:(d)CMP kinase [Clostridiaceae bacterium HSG29]